MIGFDDISFAAEIEPSLTTVRQPLNDITDAAVRQLIEIIDNPDKKNEHIILKTELIKRESTKEIKKYSNYLEDVSPQ